MNTIFRRFIKISNKDFKKDLFKLMNNLIFDETMKNVRKNCDIPEGYTGQDCVKLM